jgi:hypothetical protein
MLRYPAGLFALFALVAPCRAADSASTVSLRQLLSPAEFQNSGLGKLTATELAALEHALAEHGSIAAVAVVPSPTSKPRHDAKDLGSEQVMKPATDTAAQLRSRIEGTVGDLTGRSVFVLENGQVWQQRIPDRVPLLHPLSNPEVTVSRGIGGYTMDITGVAQLIHVKRIK